jgi:PAS domain S-box-containing protein
MRTDQQSVQQKRREADSPSVGNLNRSASILASLLLVYAVAISWYSWTIQMAQSVNELTTIATLEARAIDSYFGHLESDLKDLGENLARKDERIDLEQAYVQVRRFKELHPELFNVALINADGDVLLTAKNPPGITRVSLAKESSFTNFIEELKQENPSGIGQPLVDVLSKEVIIPVRHAIKDHQGNLRYIISANLPHEHLRSFWMDAPVMTRAAIGLIRDNGFLLSRYPVPADQPPDQIYGKPRTGALINYLQQQGFPANGSVQGPSSLDGPDFLTTFQRLPNSSVTLFVSIPMSEIRRLWLKTFTGTCFALLFLLVGGFAAYRHALRRQYAENLEQQRLDETRREADQRFRAILNSVASQVAVLDRDGVIVAVNDAWQRFALENGVPPGKPPKNTEPGSSYLDICQASQGDSAEGAAEARNGILAVLEERLPAFVLEYSCHSPAEERWFTLSVTPLVMASRGVVIVHNNITERKKFELALASSQESLRTVFSAMAEGFVLQGNNGKVLDANPAAEEILGMTRDEILGRASADPRWRTVFEDGTPFPGHQYPARVTLRTGRPLRNQLMGIHAPERGLRWISINSTPIFTRGSDTPEAAISTFIDITARHEALAALHENEERFRQAFAQSPIGMLLCQLDGHVFKANAAFRRMSGYDDDQIIGHRLGDLAPHASTADEEIALFARIASGEIGDFSVQQEQVRKDGHVYVVQSSVSLVRSSSNAPLYCLAYVEDLTERQRHQFEALAKQALSVQEEERTRLSRELHDDVGQSLTALKLTLRRVQQNCSHGQATECLRQANAATEHLMADVRAIAYRLRPAQLDDLGLMSSLRWHLDKVARPAGLEVVLGGNLGNERLPEALELCCFRVVQEALTNVLKHARASQLQVGLNRVDVRILLTLRDNGVGFDVTRHYLVPDNSRSLGLIGMRERVAAAGGRLEVKSSPGQGAEIRAWFLLP